MARLILLQEGEATPYELSEEETVIGRHPECTFQINSNMVSRKHAKIVRQANDFFVETSAAGTERSSMARRLKPPRGYFTKTASSWVRFCCALKVPRMPGSARFR